MEVVGEAQTVQVRVQVIDIRSFTLDLVLPTYLPARVRLALPETGFVRAELYDVTGRRVRVLADATLPAGTRDLVWDGRTDQGARANAGVYFVRVQAGARSGITRLVLLAQPPTY